MTFNSIRRRSSQNNVKSSVQYHDARLSSLDHIDMDDESCRPTV